MKRLIVIALVSACGSDSRTPPPEPLPQRRVIEAPTNTMTMLAPYPITAEGVGPYKLRKPIAPLLDRAQSGPLNLRFEVPNVLHSGLARTEEGGLLIGSELPAGSGTTVTFLAVIGAKVGTLASGLRVGSTKDEVVKAGLVTEDVERATDPRLVIPAGATNARIVVDDKKVAAIVLAGEPREAVRETDCVRPPATETAFGMCMITGELVERDGDDLIVRTPDQKVLARTMVPGMVFAAPLRNAAEGRDELIVIWRSGTEDTRTWNIVGFRYETGQLRKAIDLTPLYQLSTTQTRWIGAELKDLDLYLELKSQAETIEVGGLLTTTRSGRIHDVVMISPVTVPRKHHKPVTPEADAGVPEVDAGAGSSDRAHGSQRR